MTKNYNLVRLGDLCDSISGLWTGKKPPFEKATVIRNTNFTKDCKLDLSNVAVLDVETKQLQSRRLMPGDLIVEKSGGGPKQAVGRVVHFNESVGTYSLSNFTSALRIKKSSEAIPKYLQHFLYYQYISGVTETMQSNSTGIRNLNIHQFLDIGIPLPSIEKQLEIVEKLDSAFAESDLLEDNLVLSEVKANELLHSLLSDSFAYPAVGIEPAITSPKQSVTVKLVTLKDVVSFEKKQSSFDLAYVGLEDIESNTGSHLGSLEPRKVKSNTFAFTSEHLLYGRLRPYLNKVLLPNFDGHCSTEIFPIKVSKDILREYLFYWFRLQSTVEAINETSTGARMPRANMDAVLEFEIPLPPIAKQREIVDNLDRVFAEIEALKAQINMEKGYAVALRQSLLSGAFTVEEAVA